MSRISTLHKAYDEERKTRQEMTKLGSGNFIGDGKAVNFRVTKQTSD